MGEMTEPLPFSTAMAMVNERAEALLGLHAKAVERCALLESYGRVLAAPVVADRDQPPFARSTRDGFAARAEDLAAGGVIVSGLVRAGERWAGEPLGPGSCVEIMTGAPVPEGADCVAMIEHIFREQEQVTLLPGKTLKAGQNIVPQGAEALQGAQVLAAGTRVTAHGVAVAASCGAAMVRVYAKPKVAIVATGDELVDVAQTPELQQIRNSNSYTLAALVSAAGGEPRLWPPVADEARALEKAIVEAASECDLLLLSGGVSMGKYDLVEPALAALGGTFAFTGVRMQPGKPVVFGELPGRRRGAATLPFFGLPGNPVSTIVCFHLFVAPILAALAGDGGYMPRCFSARMRAGLQGIAALTQFLPGHIQSTLDGQRVAPVAWQGSGDLAAAAQANCFIVLPEGVDAVAAGELVTVLMA